MIRVVVIGGDHHNTLGVVESLALKGIRSYVILYTPYKKCYVPHSKFVESAWNVAAEESLVNCLISNFANQSDKCIIIATNDIVADIVDRNYYKLKDYCIIPSVEQKGQLAKFMSKEYMTQLANRIGLVTPKTWLIKEKLIPSTIEFPVITKAISSVAGSKDNIKICYSKDELTGFINQQHICDTIQVQQFIDKEFEFQFLGVSLNGGECVYIPGRTHIERPNGLDNTFFLRFDKCEPTMQPLVDKAVDFVKATKYTGLFSIEFLRDKISGIDYFTEMNFRNDGNAYVVTESGANLPYIYYLYCVGKDYNSEILKSQIKTTYIVPEVYYFSRMLAKEISLKEWWHNMRKADCCTTYFKKDKKAFLWFLLVGAWKRFIPNQV